jgi:hypothetical protein
MRCRCLHRTYGDENLMAEPGSGTAEGAIIRCPGGSGRGQKNRWIRGWRYGFERLKARDASGEGSNNPNRGESKPAGSRLKGGFAPPAIACILGFPPAPRGRAARGTEP